jgi:hypothetical protein
MSKKQLRTIFVTGDLCIDGFSIPIGPVVIEAARRHGTAGRLEPPERSRRRGAFEE